MLRVADHNLEKNPDPEPNLEKNKEKKIPFDVKVNIVDIIQYCFRHGF